MTPRAVEILRAYGARYPHAWRQIDEWRLARGHSVPAWPDWCYVPIAATLALTETGTGGVADRLRRVHDAEVLAALAAWRMGQGIYRWHPDLAAAVIDTPMDGAIPTALLYRLPEWGIYHDLPPGLLTILQRPVAGIFVHLEWDANTSQTELRLVFHGAPDFLFPVPLLVEAGTIAEALAALRASALRQAVGPLPPMDAPLVAAIGGAVGLTLYLAADDADIVGTEPPGNPAPVATRRGLRVFPRDRGRTWDVGWRIGAALAGPAHPTADHGGTHLSPRPHVRRAHWHTYWVGPRTGPRTRQLRWLHPVLVGADGDRPAVIHPVDP